MIAIMIEVTIQLPCFLGHVSRDSSGLDSRAELVGGPKLQGLFDLSHFGEGGLGCKSH